MIIIARLVGTGHMNHGQSLGLCRRPSCSISSNNLTAFILFPSILNKTAISVSPSSRRHDAVCKILSITSKSVDHNQNNWKIHKSSAWQNVYIINIKLRASLWILRSEFNDTDPIAALRLPIRPTTGLTQIHSTYLTYTAWPFKCTRDSRWNQWTELPCWCYLVLWIW